MIRGIGAASAPGVRLYLSYGVARGPFRGPMSAVTCIAPPRQVPLPVTQSNCRAALGVPRPGSVHPGEQPRVYAGVRQGFFMLRLYFLCANPTLARNSAVALTLRAVGGLTSRQIATAYLVTEATMARRISRPSGGSRGCRSTSPAISGRCCACSTSSSMRGTAETSTWRPRRSASPYRTLRRYSRSVDPP